MDLSNPYEAPRSVLSPTDSGPPRQQRKRPSGAFVGSLIGPLLGVLFAQARIGPAGLFWWTGKGGDTLLTPLGRTIFVIVLMSGVIGGALFGRMIEAWSRDRSAKETEIG
jgi:hypothetical protein